MLDCIAPKYRVLGIFSRACQSANHRVALRSAQIMAEAADAALAVVLQHCRAAALLPHLAGPLATDRSVKLRQCCATHLLQVKDAAGRLSACCR
jgi:hypothetical protein